MNIDPNMNENDAQEWTARRWGKGWQVTLKENNHPYSIGDKVASIYVHNPNKGITFAGHGYSGMAPWGISMWAKAAADLLKFEACALIG